MIRFGKEIADNLAAWSDEDKAKLEAHLAEYERDGEIAIDRLKEKDLVFYMQMAVLLFPHEVYKTLENRWIDQGLTDADVRAMVEKELRELKH
jgi:hypothetical protein